MFCVQKKSYILKKKKQVDKHRTIPMRFLAAQDRSRSPRKELSLGVWVKLQGFGEKHKTGRSLPILKFGRLPKNGGAF